MTEELIINTEVKGADKTEKQLDDIADATNKADDSAKEYEDTLADVGGEMEIFGTSINGIIGGFKSSVGAISNSVKSLKSFKVALASTGVGLLVIALGSLVAWLQTSQEGLNFLNDSMAVLGAVVNSLIGLLSQLGGALVKLFSGDWRGALEDSKNAFGGFVDNVKDGITATLELEEALRKLQVMQGNSNVLIASNNQLIAKNKRIIEDTTLSTQKRLEATRENQELIEKNAKFQEDLAFMELEAERQRVNNDNAQHGRNVTLLADQLILRDLEANIIDTQTANEERQIEFLTKFNELQALRNEEIRIANGLANIQNEEAKNNIEIQVNGSQQVADANKAGLDRMKKDTDAYFASVEASRQADLDLAEANAQIEFQMTADLFGALAGLAGQDSVFGKALAITQATMNTLVAITVALRAPTMAQRILGVAFATATGLKAVQDIKAVPLPQVTIAETPFAKGGIINGASHGAGGVWINAEGGEAIINKRSMGIAGVKETLSYINQLGGGVPIMANGGMVPTTGASPFTNLERALQSARTVLVLDDLDKAQANEFATQITTTL